MSGLLEVRDLTVSFPRRHAGAPVVEELSFTVDRGETVALVGESGSGKTVTALTLMGLLPDGARVHPGSVVRVGGREVTEARGREVEALRGGTVGMVFQDPLTALNPVRRVGSQLREVIRRHGIASAGGEVERTALRLLDEVGLPDPPGQMDAFPHQLSGGMRQRALIALALAGDPDLLVADEPTSALDATLQLQVLDLLAELGRRRHLGVLLITHDFGVVTRSSDRVVVLYAGRTVEAGPTETVLASPAHPYTRALLDALPYGGAPKEPLRALPGRVPPPGERAPGCAFRPRCALAREECGIRPPLEALDGVRQVACWAVDRKEEA